LTAPAGALGGRGGTEAGGAVEAVELLAGELAAALGLLPVGAVEVLFTSEVVVDEA
jgi:hypothetical protein